MPKISRTTYFLLACTLSLALDGCNGCEKKPAPDVSLATPDPSATVAATPEPLASVGAAPSPAAAKAAAVPKAATASDAAAPTASASASASAALTVASATPAPSSSAAPTPAKSGFADEIPKPCNDGFGRLGRITFTDLGGGRVRVTGSKNASATCSRVAPTQYQCDWVIDGKPTGSFGAKFDPAHKSVNGSIAKGQMFSCPPSSQS